MLFETLGGFTNRCFGKETYGSSTKNGAKDHHHHHHHHHHYMMLQHGKSLPSCPKNKILPNWHPSFLSLFQTVDNHGATPGIAWKKRVRPTHPVSDWNPRSRTPDSWGQLSQVLSNGPRKKHGKFASKNVQTNAGTLAVHWEWRHGFTHVFGDKEKTLRWIHYRIPLLKGYGLQCNRDVMRHILMRAPAFYSACRFQISPYNDASGKWKVKKLRLGSHVILFLQHGHGKQVTPRWVSLKLGWSSTFTITGEMVTYLFQQSLKEDGIQTTVENMSKWESSLNGGETWKIFETTTQLAYISCFSVWIKLYSCQLDDETGWAT